MKGYAKGFKTFFYFPITKMQGSFTRNIWDKVFKNESSKIS